MSERSCGTFDSWVDCIFMPPHFFVVLVCLLSTLIFALNFEPGGIDFIYLACILH